MSQQQSILERKFWEFHEANPEVYQHLRSFARQWRIRRGPGSQISIAGLFERVRWEVGITIGKSPKLNNNHKPYYARMLMDRDSALAGIFRLRQQQYQATIGPSNQGLEPGGQIL